MGTTDPSSTAHDQGESRQPRVLQSVTVSRGLINIPEFWFFQRRKRKHLGLT